MSEIQKYKAQVGALRSKLERADKPEIVIEIAAGAAGIEQVMQEAGLRQETEEIRPIRELWLDARWTLGRLLAKVLRSQGARADRNSTLSRSGNKFTDELKRLGLDKNRASEAQKIGTLPAKEKAAVYAEAKRDGELPTLAMLLAASRPYWKKERRSQRIKEISANNSEVETAKKFSIIYADPPWRYEHPAIGATDRSIENHYPTMTLSEICALPISDLAADDAMLYLWATAPKLEECMDVIEAWGFDYRTCAVWDKEVIGMGYHFRNQHEILLVAKRGDIPPPKAGEQPSSVYRERRGKHSAKPVYYRDLLDKMYPELEKVELFARNVAPRAGWTFWGNES